MGSQQNLIILLVVVLAGVAIYFGVQMFGVKKSESARDHIRADLSYLSKEAMAYYMRPVTAGGGGKSFVNFNGAGRLKVRTTIRRPISGTRLWESESAVYVVLSATADSVVIEGTGDDIGYDNATPVRAWGIVKKTGLYTVDKN